MDPIYLYVPLIPEQYVGSVELRVATGETWMTPDEADQLADNLREAAASARRGV